MRPHRYISALAFACTLVAATTASALEIPIVDLKIGIRGGANFSLLNNPADSGELYQYTYQNPSGEDETGSYIPYTTYVGVGWNAGAALNLRFFKIVGLEVGYQYAHEAARGTIGLPDVQDCRFSDQCRDQEVEQEFSHTAHHIPVVVQASLPIGPARPFISLGIDLVLSRTDREYTVNGQSPLPTELDPANADDQAVLDAWNRSPLAQNVLRAGLNPDTRDFYGGFIAGIGVNLVTKRIEIPIEFRFTLYPATGASTSQRGEFGDVCTEPQRLAGTCGDPLSQPAPAYNDVWTTQFFVLFGLDYLIF